MNKAVGISVRHVPSISARRLAAAASRMWLAGGLALCAFVPATREAHPWLGWLPFWLLVAPLLLLAQLELLDGLRGSTRWARAFGRRWMPRRRRHAQARRIVAAGIQRSVSVQSLSR